MNSEIDIGEVAKHSGLPASTLRYYEEKGLISSIGRNGLRRIFNRSVLDSLAAIVLARDAGFSLEEISSMFTTTGPKIDREKLADKAMEIDKKIKQLTAIREGLTHAANCPAENHFECPTFQRLLNLSTKIQRRKTGK